MNFFKKIYLFITNREKRFLYLAVKGFLKWMPDEPYLKRCFYYLLGYQLNLENPKTFNEKIQWLKLNDKNPEYIKMVDKFAVKKYVADIIGEEYVIPNLGVWDTFDEIDFESLPQRFVLKCTHDCGSTMIVKDKSEFDFKKAKKEVKKFQKRNYFNLWREWPYKNVKPRIIAEEYIEEQGEASPKDYKIFCFNGKPQIIQVDFDRFADHKRNIYDTDWNLLNAEIFLLYACAPNHIIEKPQELDEMCKIAKKLSAGIPFVRIDMYYIEGRIYFGEITFYPGAGFAKCTPEEVDLEMGKRINLTLKQS